MVDGPTPHELSERLTRLEERMNTHKAEMEAGFERLSKELAQRDKANVQWQVGLWVAAIAILGVLIRVLA